MAVPPAIVSSSPALASQGNHSEIHQLQARALIRKLSKEFSKDFARRKPEQQQSLKALAGSQMRELSHQLSRELVRQASSEMEVTLAARHRQHQQIMGLTSVAEAGAAPSRQGGATAASSAAAAAAVAGVANAGNQEWDATAHEQAWIMKRQLSRELSRQLSREISLELRRRQPEDPVKEQLRRADLDDAERRWREAQNR